MICTHQNSCINPQQSANGPTGMLGTLLSDLGFFPSVTHISNLENSLSVSQSIKSQPNAPVPWSVIQAQQSAFGGGPSAGAAPGNGRGTPAGFNPFTNSYSIPASITNNNAALNFAPPVTQPTLQGAIQATKPVNDNLNDVESMKMQPAPSQQNNPGGAWQNPNPYNTHCTGAFNC
jgi:hypothetical protein